MSKQNVSTFTASKLVGKLYFSLISSIKMPQICSICEKSAYYMAESGVKSTLSAVQSGIFGEIRSIIGRHEEKKVLQRCVDGERAEFVAIYGRRRIGKTFLVKQFFESSFDFYTTGVYQVSRSEQLKNWQKQLLKYSKQRRCTPKDWFEAFDQLQEYLQSLKKERFVVFIDELPWLDTPKSNFLKALEMFWNSWGSDCNRLKLIVCGSATTWMINKLLGDKGGLHNRVTMPICLSPFTLHETSQYLTYMGFDWSDMEVIETYMVLGGVPYYLSLLSPSLSLRQNIDNLFFKRNAVLKTEYDFLFNSLYSEAQAYKKVVELLSSKMIGMTRSEMMSNLKLLDNGFFSIVLDNLEKCDFIRHYQSFGKRRNEALYQLTDMFTLFFVRFVKNYNGMDENAWSHLPDGKRNAWQGYAYEQVCIHHINQIKKALGISGIASDVCSWTKKGENGAQIDLVIDRSDRVIDLCEIKYCDRPFEIKKDYADWLKERRDIFRENVRTNKTLHLTMITPFGLAKGKYESCVQGCVTAADLFQ